MTGPQGNMNSVTDLNMIKGRDVKYQRTVIDDLTDRFQRSPSGIDAVLREMPKDDLVDLSQERPDQAIRYALLAMIAADIATVPYKEGIAYHMEGLKELASNYGLSIKKIIYLTIYAEAWMSKLEALEETLR
jgi:hypothetical protein